MDGMFFDLYRFFTWYPLTFHEGLINPHVCSVKPSCQAFSYITHTKVSKKVDIGTNIAYITYKDSFLPYIVYIRRLLPKQ